MTDISLGPGTDDVFDQEELLAQAWGRIAEGIAALSEASETPATVPSPTSILDGSEVDLNSDAWMVQFADVQGWLNFSRDLPISSPEGFLESLVAELGLDNSSGLERSDGKLRLSLRGWEQLEYRVETGVRLQRQFLDSRGNGDSRDAATESWQEGWNEYEHDMEPVGPEPINAKADVWHIFQLTKKKLNLTPTYQRGDVWTTKDRQALIESILRGIPLPSLILLRTKGSAPHEVVDGKQRLTAILRFVGAHPRALEKVAEADRDHPDKNLKHLFETDYRKFRRAWASVMQEPLSLSKEDEYYFPFKLRSGGEGGLVGPHLEPMQGKYYTEIKDREIVVGDQELNVAELFEGAPDYKVPVIEYTSAKSRQIHEVFKLYNKQGVHLNAEELRNAAYHDVEITRAILFAAGDADLRADLSAFAPSLLTVPHLSTLGENLQNYKIGTSRYKRTKILGWVIATLLLEAEQENLKSTASHIDELLRRVQSAANDPLRDRETLSKLFALLVRAVELHSGNPELWSPRFMDTKDGLKWQELQLVGSLVGIALSIAASPDDVEERIETHADDVRAASESGDWQRPRKTQTRTQWDYIARIAEGVVLELGLEPDSATQSVRDQFGSSGYESLQRSRLSDR